MLSLASSRSDFTTKVNSSNDSQTFIIVIQNWFYSTIIDYAVSQPKTKHTLKKAENRLFDG